MLQRYEQDGGTSTRFEVLPAIDLRGGRVVRLVRGDFDAETVYDADAAATAERFADAGAKWLHVVDLDGAREGRSVNGDAVAAIVARVGERVSVEVAGGIRTEESADSALEAGARRVVVGTAALRDPSFAGSLARRFGPDRVAVALDVRDGLAVGAAWAAGSVGVPVEAALDALASAGIATFEVTAIDRDGTLAGPDLPLLDRLIALRRGAIVASAGIASSADIRAVREIGCVGAIVGRSLYEGRLTIEEALAAAR